MGFGYNHAEITPYFYNKLTPSFSTRIAENQKEESFG